MLIRSAEWNHYLVNVPYSIGVAKMIGYTMQLTPMFKKAVYNHWTGGPEWWTDIKIILHFLP